MRTSCRELQQFSRRWRGQATQQSWIQLRFNRGYPLCLAARRFTVSQALSALAAQAPNESTNKPTLLKLAEHIAVRFALESYERGDVKVNAVRELLEEMNQELDGLRKILGVYEENA